MSIEKISYRNHLITFGIFWMGWLCLYAWLIYNLGFSWHLAVTDSLINNSLLALICLAMHNTFRYYHPGKAGSLFVLPWTILLAGGTAWLVTTLLRFLLDTDIDYLLFLEKAFAIRMAFAFLMIALFILLGWMWYFINNKQEFTERRNELERLAREAELNGLRQQLQPHFLFNSLNSINALTLKDREKASEMIVKLSDFFRGTLTRDDSLMVPLSEELRHLELYLDIEGVRFGHRMKREIIRELEDEKDWTVPSLILQPVVENAIKFGLYDTVDLVLIRISIKEKGNQLLLEVQNPFDPETPPAHPGTGFGLTSVARRLYLIYGRNDLLETSAQGLVFTTQISIPSKA